MSEQSEQRRREDRKSSRWVWSIGLGPDRREPEPEPETDAGWTPEVGDRKTFEPTVFSIEHAGVNIRNIVPQAELRVTGTVVFVHREHRWYRVRYDGPDGPQHECFKF